MIKSNLLLWDKAKPALRSKSSVSSRESSKEIAKAIAPAFPDSDIKLITNVVENYKNIDAWKTDPLCNESDFNQLIKVITDAGIEVEKADYDKIVDNSFAKKAK